MLNILIITANKSIPFKNILDGNKICQLNIIFPEGLFDSDELKRINSFYHKVYTIKNFSSTAELESLCYKIYKSNPYDRLVALNEQEFLWASKVRDNLNLDGQRYKQAILFRDKVYMKDILTKNGFRVPDYTKINCYTDIVNFIEGKKYPFVVKPRRDTISAGVHILKDKNHTERFLKKQNFLDHFYFSKYMIESYVDLPLYQIDCIIENNKINFAWPAVAINKWVDIKDGKVVGKYFLSKENVLVGKMRKYAERLINIFPINKNMIIHIEAFYDNCSDEFVFCEIASRLGGMHGRDIWLASFNIDLGKEFIRAQAGLPYTFTNGPIPERPKNISGYALLPICDGYLSKFPLYCNVPGVKEFTNFLQKKETNYVKSRNIENIAGAVLIEASSEHEFFKRFEALEDWYKRSYIWNS